MDEAEDEVQAQAAIKLAENVSALIREEIKKAFANYAFTYDVTNPYSDNNKLFGALLDIMRIDLNFKNVIRQICKEEIQKIRIAPTYTITTKSTF